MQLTNNGCNINWFTGAVLNKTLTAPVIEGGTVGNSTPVTIAKIDNVQIDANTISTTKHKWQHRLCHQMEQVQ